MSNNVVDQMNKRECLFTFGRVNKRVLLQPTIQKGDLRLFATVSDWNYIQFVNSNTSETLATTVVLSIIFHFLLIWVLVKYAPNSVFAPTTPIEVVYQNETNLDPKKQRYFVRSTEVPDDLLSREEPTHPADMLAAKTQRVREQMRASKSGPTQNNIASPKGQLTKKELLQLAQSNPFAQNFETRDEGIPVNTKQEKDATSSPLSRFQEATLSEVLPDEIKAGHMTVLNTDRHLFASFYDRFGDLTRYRWIRHLREEYFSGLQHNAPFSPGTTYATILEVILDSKGFVKQIVVKRGAGWPGFDRAVLNAIQEVQQFPNPPPEMVQRDGTIRVYAQYLFTLR